MKTQTKKDLEKQNKKLLKVIKALAPCIYGNKTFWFEEKLIRKTLKKQLGRT